MTILKRVMTNLVMFVLGVEVGGFTAWYLTMAALKKPISNRTKTRDHVSYKNGNY